MKSVFYFLCLCFFPWTAFSTAQQPDFLLMGNDTLAIHSNPLEGYFKNHSFPEQLITMHSTGNWRGYIAFFKFDGDNLVVENIYKEEQQTDAKGQFNFLLKSIYKDVFGINEYFPCDFYNGLLICPQGDILEYVHMGYSSLYEKYKLFEIKSGLKIKTKEMTGIEYQKFKIDYYRYYKLTEDYKIKREEFKQMAQESDTLLDPLLMAADAETNKKQKKENKYLKAKEAEFRVEKELDSFMFLFLDDYIITIDIPKK